MTALSKQGVRINWNSDTNVSQVNSQVSADKQQPK